MTIYSPIILNQPCEKIEDLDASIIAEKYKKEYNIDVNPYFENQQAAIYRCPVSMYRFYHPKELMANGAFYEHLEKFTEGIYYPKKWEHYEALKFINKSDRVLEIGCGNGNFFEICVENEIVNLTGLELNKVSIAGLKEKGFSVYDSTVEKYAFERQGERFNVICSFQVLEHIYDVYNFFKSAISLLDENGRLIIAVPNNNPFFLKHDKYHTLNLPPHHVGLWDEHSLRFIENVFNIKVISYKTEPLQQYKEWFRVQRNYLISRNKTYKILNLIPRPIYKLLTRLFSSKIEGSYSFIVYQKKGSH